MDIIADLFHAPLEGGGAATGTATIGSSEAIMLGTLAMKRRWEERRKTEGKPTDKPNLVMGYNVQVVSHRAALLLTVERQGSCPQRCSWLAVLGEGHQLLFHRGEVRAPDRGLLRGQPGRRRQAD